MPRIAPNPADVERVISKQDRLDINGRLRKNQGTFSHPGTLGGSESRPVVKLPPAETDTPDEQTPVESTHAGYLAEKKSRKEIEAAHTLVCRHILEVVCAQVPCDIEEVVSGKGTLDPVLARRLTALVARDYVDYPRKIGFNVIAPVVGIARAQGVCKGYWEFSDKIKYNPELLGKLISILTQLRAEGRIPLLPPPTPAP